MEMEKRICPKCNKSIRKISIFCSQCGARIKNDNIHTRRCIRCDEPVNEGDVECPKCKCSWNDFYEQSLKSNLLDGLVYENIGREIVIIGYSGDSTVIDIPNFIGGYPVKEIGNDAFCEKEITSLTIPLSIRKIGKYAFRDCKSIEKLQILNYKTELGEGAFTRALSSSWATIYIVDESPFHQWIKEVTRLTDPMDLKNEFPNLIIWPKEW